MYFPSTNPGVFGVITNAAKLAILFRSEPKGLLARGEVNSILNKWALALAATAVVVIGCGGGGGSNGGGGNGGNGGNGGGGGPSVNLGTGPGVLTFEFLTGAGRVAGDMSAVINHVSMTDPNTAQIYETVVNPERDLLLNGYTINTVNLNIPGINTALLFDQFPLEIAAMKVQNAQGGTNTINGPGGAPLVFENFPAHINIFPGRTSNVAIRLDDTMFTLNGNSVDFDDSVFLANNTSPVTGGTVNGYLADYVMFDLTHLTGTEPLLPNSGTPASRVYFTGDNYAVSTDTPTSGVIPGEFDVLTPVGFVEGTYTNPARVGSTIFPGTFTLVQPDPRDPDPGTALRITALQGIWRDVNSVVNNAGDFLALSLPSSQDNNFQTILFVKRTGGNITEMYFGLIDLNAGTLQAFPIDQVSPGSTDNEIDGTVMNLLDRHGNPTSDPTLVHSGTFSLVNGTGTVPADFPTTGTFIVFRR